MTSRGWEIYTREVRPIEKKRLKPRAPAKHSPEKAAARAAASTEPIKLSEINAPNSLSGDVYKSLERTREKSLRQGNFEIDAKLDLHGMTQVEAFKALTEFMRKITKAGKRHLLIITGKGIGGAGVLRSNLENWLGQLPESPSILALRPAASKHGGEGAFYVVMRKK